MKLLILFYCLISFLLFFIYYGARNKSLSEIAYHEAGHIIASYYTFGPGVIKQGTIVPRKGSLGLVDWNDSFKKLLESESEPEKYFKGRIIIDFAGKTAMLLKFGQAWGYKDDIRNALECAKEIINEKYTGITLQQKINELLSLAEKESENILKEHFALLDCVAQKLLEKKTLTGKEIDSLIENFYKQTPN